MKKKNEKFVECWERILSQKRWFLCVLIIFICLLLMCFIAVKTKKPSDEVSDVNLAEENYTEPEEHEDNLDNSDIGDINEWYDDYETVYYDDKKIMRYDEKYMGVCTNNYQIAQFFWFGLEKYTEVPEDFDPRSCTLQNRTENLYRLKIYSDDLGEYYYSYFEIEQNKKDNNIYYAKITNSIGSDAKYYAISLDEDGFVKIDPESFELVEANELTKDSYRHYLTNVKEVNFEDIENNVFSFSKEENPLVNNRTYAEYVLNSSGNADGNSSELYLEGDSDPADVDKMMEFLGLEE